MDTAEAAIEADLVVVDLKRKQCFSRLAQNAVKIAKFLSSHEATGQFFVEIVLKNRIQEIQDSETQAVVVVQALAKKGCLKQPVISAVTVAKSHFAQPEKNQFIAVIVLEKWVVAQVPHGTIRSRRKLLM